MNTNVAMLVMIIDAFSGNTRDETYSNTLKNLIV